jgi:periodic tryptophan protein 1
MSEESFSSDENIPNFAQETNMLRGKKIDDEYPEGFEEISEEEKDDFTIKKTDAMFVAAKLEGEYATLEVYVYEEAKCNLFVHHEITLSAFPLCMEHL